ncbi:MAG: hypothetical protein AB1671_09430 [Thermodesulfobacteriota bacterium]|jgi:hypothetical protein
MAGKHFFLALCVSCCCATAALADAPARSSPEEGAGGVSAVARSVLSLPFKGVICLAGLISMPAAYLGSGLDPQVEDDTTRIRNHYCSGEYFLSPKWEE